MNDQLTIFDELYKQYKITNPIRLIEFFGGYGSQYFALKYLDANVEHWKLCEWASKSIQAYNDAHIQDYTDYSKDISDNQILDRLVKFGVSLNYNEPATKEQLKRQNYRTIFNNIVATNNLVNIQNVHGSDLQIENKESFTYLLTYSFPCQDLSLAGKRKGMEDTSTRSGMLWEVERILKELHQENQLPQVLLMENVPQVHGEGNVNSFNKWQLELEKIGYKNYFQDLIATDYGIPQTRNRCFMVSILGEYNYTFPKPIPLKLKLKDLLEEEVDEKYFLTNKQIDDISQWNAYEKPLEHIDDEIVGTITTRSGAYCAGMKLTSIPIKNANSKGYINANIGDGIDISSRMQYHRGTVQKDKSQTLTTKGGENNGVVVGTYQYAKSDNFMQGKPRFQKGKDVSDTIQTTQKEGIVYNNLRIRKLIPKECGRLMGLKDKDIDNIAKNLSEAAQYHVYGDSIVINVLMAIFKEMI